MKMKMFVIVIFSLVLVSCIAYPKKKLNNIFYAQNTLKWFKNAPQTASEKAKLLKTIGYDGLEGFGYKDFFELKKALDEEGLKMPVNYVALNFNADGKLDDTLANEIKTMIKSSSNGSIIYFYIQSNTYKNNKETGDKLIVAVLRDLSDYSLPYGIKLCIYPHLSTYCETVAHSVKLAKMVDRKNYGSAMNLCHLLKVEGSEGIDEKIKEFAPYLFAVNICGADNGDTKSMGWDRLIQPLGQGSFDTYHFVKSLRDNGYRGPIGLQCYHLSGDAVETLTRSLQIWEEYKKQYAMEK